jgi:hypothetical protein
MYIPYNIAFGGVCYPTTPLPSLFYSKGETKSVDTYVINNPLYQPRIIDK